MSGVLKESAFEASIEAHLLANGWSRGTPAGYDRALGLDPSELIAFMKASQPDEWEQLCLRLGGEAKAASKVVERVAKELDARGTVDVLRRETKLNGVRFRVAFFAPANDLTPELRARYDANRLSVVRQLHHSESRPADSLDLVLLVNGVPTATAELKNSTSGQSVADAIAQYRVDRNPNDLIFKHRVVVNFAVDPDQVWMTTRLAGPGTRFLPFNQGSNGPGLPGGAGNPPNPDGYRTAYLWERVWARDAWLSLLGEFVHVEDELDAAGAKTGERRLLFPRFHQWDLVEKLLAATRDAGPGVNRLAMHSAGSGKSNSIAWSAHRLSRLHTPGDPASLSEGVRAAGLSTNQPIFSKVIVITDRRVLDAQLQATVAGFEHTPGTIVKIDQDSKQLAAALAGNAARIIITTLQKFPVVAEAAAKVAGARFAVIVDEAHSSTGGEAMTDLKKVLTGIDPTDDQALLAAAESAEAAASAGAVVDAADLLEVQMAARGRQANLSFFAFTATPKPKTLELFGELLEVPGEGEQYVPFHVYSMKQAIAEGFILDVLANYTTYETYYRLANAEPEDPQVPVAKASAALARFVTLHPTHLAQRAEVIVEHFRAKTAHKIDGHAKAMVVTRSRLHAVRTKQAIDAYIAKKGYDKGPGALRALVAFSGTVEDPASGVSYTEPLMNGIGEKELPKRFATDEYQVLVVAEKYQTGYDEPLLHTMYVDKKLAGVKAVQTLSRLNRTHPGKTDTFILDFANTVEEIQDAFAPFYEGTAATPTDPNLLYAMQRTLLDAGVIHPDELAAAVAALLAGGAPNQKVINAHLDPAVERFTLLPTDEERVRFRDTLTGYVRAYSFLAQVMSWTDRELEELYLYARMLASKLPAGPGEEPVPHLSDAIRLTHLRTEATAVEVDASLEEGDETPGTALPGGGAGRQNEPPRERLSVLIDTLNERFGMNLTDADKVWFEQQKQAVKDSDEARVVALNNDRDAFHLFLRRFASDAIIDRHEANGMLFNAYFEKPGFADALLEFLAGSYDEIRDEGAG
jgi:type I restriction enzyme R subunit